MGCPHCPPVPQVPALRYPTWRARAARYFPDFQWRRPERPGSGCVVSVDGQRLTHPERKPDELVVEGMPVGVRRGGTR